VEGRFGPQDGKQMGFIHLTNQERALIYDCARVMKAKLREQKVDLFARTPDNTPFWKEQVDSVDNMLFVWEDISDKMGIAL